LGVVLERRTFSSFAAQIETLSLATAAVFEKGLCRERKKNVFCPYGSGAGF
jgi:hypothetical protein